MKQEKIKKPENYTEGGLNQIKKTLLGATLQIMFIISSIIWIVSSIFVSASDVISGEFNNKWVSFSFIGGISIASYLSLTKYVKGKKLGIKKTKKTCSKCGKK